MHSRYRVNPLSYAFWRSGFAGVFSDSWSQNLTTVIAFEWQTTCAQTSDWGMTFKHTSKLFQVIDAQKRSELKLNQTAC
jgi:hypothetical protein